jgi:hypothetical protein
MAFWIALLAAVSFAFGSVLQQKGALQTPAAEGDPRFLAQVIRQPVWLLGGLCQVGGWVLQAVALDTGSLVVVQSTVTLSLVIALPLGVRFTDQHVGRRSIIAAVAVVSGITLFVAVGQPSGGIDEPGAAAWWSAILVSAAAMTILGLSGTRRSGAPAAALFACAAGVGFALQASVTKVFMGQLGSGLSGILTSWTTYVLIISALLGFGLQQSALKTGFLAPAMAASNATTLGVSVLLGLTVFGETLAGRNGHLAPAVIGLVIAVIGVIGLATNPEGSSPRSGDASGRTSAA